MSPTIFLFFSFPTPPEAPQGWLAALQDRGVLAPLAWDLGLLLLFVGQHSLMATETVKVWLSRYFGVLQRSLYVACTALALQVGGPQGESGKDALDCGGQGP